jgi:peptidoglycan/LPS O-acetylase OafA/YrhL
MPIVRTPLFLFGCAIAPWADRGERIPGWVAPVSLAAYIAIALLPDGTTAPFFRGTSYHFLSIFLVIALTRLSQLLAQCNFLRWIYDALVFCGDVSLEIYLIYTRLLYFMAKLPVYKSGGIGHLKLECVTILLTFILAPLLRKSCYIRSRKQIN